MKSDPDKGFEPGEAGLMVSGKRPHLLSVICIISFIYNGLITISFLTAAFFPSFLLAFFNNYFPEWGASVFNIYIIVFSGVFLFGLTFYSVLRIWWMKRSGVYMYIPLKVMLLAGLVITGYYYWLNLAFSVLFILIYISYIKYMNARDN